MMFAIAIIPLILGMAVVIMALVRKLKPQAVTDKFDDLKKNDTRNSDFNVVQKKDDVLVRIR